MRMPAHAMLLISIITKIYIYMTRHILIFTRACPIRHVWSTRECPIRIDMTHYFIDHYTQATILARNELE